MKESSGGRKVSWGPGDQREYVPEGVGSDEDEDEDEDED